MTEGSSKDEKEIRKALQFSVCKIIFDEDRKQGTRTTQSAIAALTELTYQYATKSLVPDLYTFSTHANRKSTISPDDVAIALRKLQPDQLEAFKRSFCRGGSKPSKNTAAYENDDSGKRMAGGCRRKRSETDVLSLSSSSSSSSSDDNNERANGNLIDRKRKRNPGRSSASSHNPTNAMLTDGRKSSQRESLLNKFQLRSEPSASALGNKKNVLEYDTLSSDDDDDITKSTSKVIGITKTARLKEAVAATTAQKNRVSQKLSLQPIPFRKKEQSNSNFHNNTNEFLSDDDTTDDEDLFLGRNTNRAGGKSSIGSNYPVANPSDRDKSIRNSRQNFDDDNDDDDDDDNNDDHFDTGNDRNYGERNSGDGFSRGTPKQSQVAEALANLSSDSGMDEDDSEEDSIINSDKFGSSHGHRPRIECDDDD